MRSFCFLSFGLMVAACLVESCAQGETRTDDDWGEITTWGVGDADGGGAPGDADPADAGPPPDIRDKEPDLAPPRKTCLDEAQGAAVWSFFSKSCAQQADHSCCDVDLGEVLAARIAAAQATADVCVMELQDFTVSDALVAAHHAGRQVRVVLDDGYADPGEEKAVADLLAAGIVPAADTKDPDKLMHSKFMVLDGRFLVVSSGNCSTYDAASNANNLVVFDSPAAAQVFTQRFEAMWGAGRFHKQVSPGPHKVNVDGWELEIWFGPSDGMFERLRQVISSAQSALHFQIYAFTHEDVKEAMAERCNAVEVRGVYDGDQANDVNSVVENGWCAAADVRPANVQGDFGFTKLHHKVLIVDPGTAGALVVAGSANWSFSAQTKNDEVMIFVRDPRVVAAYEAEFQARFTEAGKAR